MRRCAAIAAALVIPTVSAIAAAPNGRPSTVYVSGRVPIVGPSKALSAIRASGLSPRRVTPSGASVNTWTKLGTMSGAVVHDVTFVSPTVGYAAAELGQVWETTDGGAHWVRILNRGFPYYYYGIYALGETVIASGFNDSSGEGLLSESDDGGATWNADKIL